MNSALCLVVIAVCLSPVIGQGIGFYAARATGESMQPALPRDAFLVLERREPEIGDIVHVENHRFNIVHRIVDLQIPGDPLPRG